MTHGLGDELDRQGSGCRAHAGGLLGPRAGERKRRVDSGQQSGLVWGQFDAAGIFYAGGWGEGPSAWHRETLSAGSCRLLELEPATCEGCTAICVADGQCQPWPDLVSVGDIDLQGLIGGLGVTYQFGPYTPDGDTPSDLFEAGSEISATAEGDELPGFDVATVGVHSLIADVPERVDLSDGQDLTIRWTPSDGGARVHLQLKPVKYHGVPISGVIECDVPDTGTLTVPGQLVDAFPAGDTTPPCDHGCPPSVLSRYRVGSAQMGAAGQVDLWVSSQVEFWVRKP